MFPVHFYASCFDSRENAVGKKTCLDWEKTVYRPLFALANTVFDETSIFPTLCGATSTFVTVGDRGDISFIWYLTFDFVLIDGD